MYVILGGCGNVGSATARALLDQGQDVTVVTRSKARGAELEKAGARTAVADIRDVDALRAVFQLGKRAFLLNPPADPAEDTDEEERMNVAAMLTALQGSGLEKVVAQSTYGAFEGTCCGDLTVLYELERGLLSQPIPAAINRAGYYMSNWSGMLGEVKRSGILPSFFPGDLPIPMVAPNDLGELAATRLMSGTDDSGVMHIEGPERYTAEDAASSLAILLNCKVKVHEIPPQALEETFLSFGYSEKAAASYACMTRRMIDGQADTSDQPVQGKVSLAAYLKSLLPLMEA